MFENIMSAERHSLLEQLVSRSLVQDFYLAGGTAAALYIGHRWSEDLDFFTEQKFDPFHLAGKLAALTDIGLMKLVALMQRGARKDFVVKLERFEILSQTFLL